MTRVMCVHFPDWSLQRIRHERPDLRVKPFAVTRPIVNKGSKVTACCPRAHRHGVRPGMVAAEALATLPSLTCVEEDLDADRRALVRLAGWAERYSPLVGLEDALAPTCLFVDVTGGAACFGGEEALLQKACAEFEENGWTVRIALAATMGAGWALAHRPIDNCQLKNPFSICNCQLSIVNCQCIALLSTEALRLSPATITLLDQLGIERIGQLTELPRDQIAERFGAEVGLRLDQALGRAREVITPLHPEPEAAASWAFDDPVERRDVVQKVLDILLERLQTILEKRHGGARLLECVFELDGAESQRLECSLSRPAQTASYLSGLLRTRLEAMRVEAPIRALSIRALVLERMADEQPNLFEAGNDAQLERLLDTLSSRLGKDAVTRARFVADPQPELACRFESALRPEKRAAFEEPRVFAHRPLRLFARPVAVEMDPGEPSPVRGRLSRPIFNRPLTGLGAPITHCHGPERIATGWWRGNDVNRDYYLVETAVGTRWWIFRRLSDGRWFLHGCFD